MTCVKARKRANVSYKAELFSDSPAFRVKTGGFGKLGTLSNSFGRNNGETYARSVFHYLKYTILYASGNHFSNSHRRLSLSPEMGGPLTSVSYCTSYHIVKINLLTAVQFLNESTSRNLHNGVDGIAEVTTSFLLKKKCSL